MPYKSSCKSISAAALLTLLLFLTASAQTGSSGLKDNTHAKESTVLNESSNKNASGVSTEEKSTTSGNNTPDTSGKTGADSTKKNDSAKKDARGAEVWDDNKKAEKIEATLEYGMQKDRKIAVQMINEIKDEQIKNRLLQKLESIIDNDSDIEVRKAAVTVLGDNKSLSAAPVLIKALDDPSEDIKIAACYAIGRVKADSAKQRLVEIYRKQDLKADSNLTDALIITLGELKAPDILDSAVTAGKDASTSRMIRERLIIYIGYTGSAAQKDFLVELYKDEEEEMLIRCYAIKSISKLKLKETTGDIKSVIKDIDSFPFNKKKKYYDLYMYSVTALVEMGDTDSISLLMNSLRSDNASVRLKAINLIKEFNDERTIDILKYKMKNDPSPKVRKASRKALEDKGIIEKGKEDDAANNEYDKEEKDE